MKVPGIVAGMVLAVALAGCTGGQAEGLSEPVALPAEGLALVRVLVINDEYWPITSADVFLLDIARNATTNFAGDAFFEDVPLGAHTVHVQADGYLPSRHEVQIEEDGLVTIRVPMKDRPQHTHLVEFRRAAGSCMLAAQTTQGVGTERCQDTPYTHPSTIRYGLEKGLDYAQLDIDWNSFHPMLNTMAYEVRILDDVVFKDGSEALLFEGTPPLKIVLDEDILPDAATAPGKQLQVRALPPEPTAAPSVVVAHVFDVYATLFYTQEPVQPDGETRAG